MKQTKTNFYDEIDNAYCHLADLVRAYAHSQVESWSKVPMLGKKLDLYTRCSVYSSAYTKHVLELPTTHRIPHLYVDLKNGDVLDGDNFVKYEDKKQASNDDLVVMATRLDEMNGKKIVADLEAWIAKIEKI